MWLRVAHVAHAAVLRLHQALLTTQISPARCHCTQRRGAPWLRSHQCIPHRATQRTSPPQAAAAVPATLPHRPSGCGLPQSEHVHMAPPGLIEVQDPRNPVAYPQHCILTPQRTARCLRKRCRCTCPTARSPIIRVRVAPTRAHAKKRGSPSEASRLKPRAILSITSVAELGQFR